MQVSTDLIALIGADAALGRTGNTWGGEYAGPCPFCGGNDRFLVWPDHPSGRGRFWCRQCGEQGDAIDYLRRRDGLGFRDACEQLEVDIPEQRDGHQQQPIKEPAKVKGLCPPSATWQVQGRRFVEQARECLWSEAGIRALEWVRGRGLEDATIQVAGLGFNPEDQREEPEVWGFETDHKAIWLPRGIVIPWEIGGELWRVNIRRPQGEPKYIGPAGYSKGLFGADVLIEHPAFPAVLVEGEFDALTLRQAAGDLVAVVATGSTAGARQPRWLGLLAQSPVALLSFDADAGGDEAADWWLGRLPQARRWRPFWGDVNELVQDGVSVRDWIQTGLGLDAWQDLEKRLEKAQLQFDAGQITTDEFEQIALNLTEKSQQIPR